MVLWLVCLVSWAVWWKERLSAVGSLKEPNILYLLHNCAASWCECSACWQHDQVFQLLLKMWSKLRQIFCLVFSCNFDQIYVNFSLLIIGSWLNLCLLVSILAWLELAQEVAWNFSWSFLSNLIDIFTRMIFFTESAEGDNCRVPENDHLFDEGALSAFCGSVNPFPQSEVIFLLQLWGGCKHLLSPFSRVNGSS